MPTILFMFSFFNGASVSGTSTPVVYYMYGDYPCRGVDA